MGERRAARRPGYEDYKIFPSRKLNHCSLCRTSLPTGQDVIGKHLGGGRWDIVCVPCGSGTTAVGRSPARSSAPISRTASGSDWVAVGGRTLPGTASRRSAWSTLVEYLRSCVERESLVAPIPLNQRERWSVLPVRAETVLCGNDLTLPLLPELRGLFTDLEPLEGVFYGWPTMVVLDDRQRPFVAPLFVRRLEGPDVRHPFVPVEEMLPHINGGLLGLEWFPPEVLTLAAETIAGRVLGFGDAGLLVRTATDLLTALGVPLPDLDPTSLIDFATLGDPWRPREVGAFNMVMAFKGELDAATRNLVKDLGWMIGATNWRHSAARFLFEDAPVPSLSLAESCAVTLNDSQEAALACAATAPLTVITGPPGTGKSQTVTAILAEAWRRGETALLSSTNNTPVDDVIDTKTAVVDDALVLRTGNADKRRDLSGRLPDLVDEVLGRHVDPAASSLARDALVRHQAAHALHEQAEVSGRMLGAAIRRNEARASVWGEEQPPPSSMTPSVRSRASRTVRTRWRWLQRRRTNRLRELAGIRDPAVTAQQVLDWLTSEASFDDAERALTAFQQANPGDLMERFVQANDRWQEVSRATIRNRVLEGFTNGEESLRDLAGRLTEDLERREAIARAMTYIKGWATSALSVRPNFDCSAGTIDLVVIDEASQCNLAQVLPLAYRAKRLVIVGDPEQLSPVVTANAEELRTLAIAAGRSHDELAAARLRYGQDSAYTAFAARFHPEPLLLDEHYRCHPDIIRYCNEQFYGNKLTVLTSVDRDGDAPRGVEWHDVVGRTEPGRTGSAVNQAEAEAVVAWIVRSGLAPDQLGVVTPFRAQAAKIEALLARQGNDRLAEVRVGTAHRFQGGERDTIVFSTVISTGALPGTVRWLEGERNLINVAVSRARRHLVVFGNRAELRERKVTTLLGLAEIADRAASRATAAPSPATKRLHAALTAKGLPVSVHEVDEGYPLALVVTALNGDRINIEVDEFPDGDPRGRRQRQLATRDSNVRRLGWRVLRVPGWQAYLGADAIADDVRELVTG